MCGMMPRGIIIHTYSANAVLWGFTPHVQALTTPGCPLSVREANKIKEGFEGHTGVK